MKTSETLKELPLALAAAQGELKDAEENSENPAYGSKYANLEAYLPIIRPVLSKHNIVFTQGVNLANKTLETLLLHKSGEFIRYEMPLLTNRQDMQGLGSAITYARRYSLASALGMGSEDDDGEASKGSGNRGQQNQQRQNQQGGQRQQQRPQNQNQNSAAGQAKSAQQQSNQPPRAAQPKPDEPLPSTSGMTEPPSHDAGKIPEDDLDAALAKGSPEKERWPWPNAQARTEEIARLRDKFKQIGVSDADIERRFKVGTLDMLTNEQLQELQNIGTEIVNKRATVGDYFGIGGKK